MATTSRTTPRTGSAPQRPALKTASRQKPEMIKVSYEHRPFRRINFYMMAGCVALIVIGFLFMLGGSSSVEEGFNPDIFSTRRIVIGPTITFLGFLLMAFAIIWAPKKHRTKTENDSES